YQDAVSGIGYDPASNEGMVIPNLEDAQPLPDPRIEPTPGDYTPRQGVLNELGAIDKGPHAKPNNTPDQTKLEGLGPVNRDHDHTIQNDEKVRVPAFTSPEAAAEQRRRTNEATGLDQQG